MVTLPSQSHVGGRFTLALYHMLGYGYQPFDATAAHGAAPAEFPSDPEVAYSPLVTASVQEYVNLAIRLVHQPKLRQFHSERILSRRHRLFQQDSNAVLAQWR